MAGKGKCVSDNNGQSKVS